jgi:hypothetical protein
MFDSLAGFTMVGKTENSVMYETKRKLVVFESADCTGRTLLWHLPCCLVCYLGLVSESVAATISRAILSNAIVTLALVLVDTAGEPNEGDRILKAVTKQ